MILLRMATYEYLMWSTRKYREVKEVELLDYATTSDQNAGCIESY